jgi:hypothetical protein
MAIVVNVLTVNTNHRRTIYSVDDAPGSTEPIFLGSKYAGESVQLGMLVTGATFAEAQTYIDTTLKALFKTQEIVEISPTGDIVALGVDITGKVEALSFSKKPNNRRQRVNMSFKLGYSGE